MRRIAILVVLPLLSALAVAAEDFTPPRTAYSGAPPEKGSGPEAKVGHAVLIHETTKKADGTVVTDTFAMNHPLRFEVGGNQVIQGVDEGVRGMKVGEIRELIVPPALSKRTAYSEGLSPDDVLYYEI